MKILSLIFAALVAFMFTGCFTPSSVLVKKPWFFGHGGVEPESVKTGLVWTAFSTEVIRVNVKPYNVS
jgi:hypothetical protein